MRSVLCIALLGSLGCTSDAPQVDRRAAETSAIATEVAVHTVSERLEVGGASIELEISVGERAASDAEIAEWVARSAGAVAAYYGRFPVDRARVLVLSGRGRRVSDGWTTGWNGVEITVRIGDGARPADLARDWLMTHEMVHTGTPSLAEQHHWLEEGIATYVEPLVRARIGLIEEAEVWREWMRDYRQGLPGPGDRGLDWTPTWGRTYYGGAIFCLLADVEIRRRTDNARSLQDALVAVVRAGGNITHQWPIERVLSVGDEATGTTALAELYERFGRASEPIDLDALWRELGIALRGRELVLDESAPLAGVRREIVLGGRAAVPVTPHPPAAPGASSRTPRRT